MQGMMTSSVCFKLRQIVNPTRRALSTDVLKSANESSVGTRVQVAKFCCTKTEKKKTLLDRKRSGEIGTVKENEG
jgi:hypothetical protein